MTQPLVSWLMPVYNSEDVVCRAMDSILNQTYKNFEVIVIDDCCTDGTAKILDCYALSDKRVHVYRNEENIGVALSLNRGLDLCNGKYIARMDADDRSHPQRLEKQLAFMETNPDYGVLGTQCLFIHENGSHTSECPKQNENIKMQLLFNTVITHPTVMMRMETIKEHNAYYPLELAEDYALWVWLLSKTKMANLPDVLYEYYISPKQVTTKKFKLMRKNSAEISKRAIKKVFYIDTTDYPAELFGWRGSDFIQTSTEKYLSDGAKLLREIEEANRRLNIFNENELRSVLLNQWDQTKADVCLYSLPAEFDSLFDSHFGAIERFIKVCGNRQNILLYGAGVFCENIIKRGYPFDIMAVCDSDEKKQGTVFCGKKILAPNDILRLEYDYIFISSTRYYEEIYKFLIDKLHVKEDKILPLLSIRELLFHAFKQELMKSSETASQEPIMAYLFCAPDYGNLGDHAILEAERRFLKKNYKGEITEVPFSLNQELLPIIKERIQSNDLILITGGGFLGSLWFSAEEQVRKIVGMFPDNPVIIFPQTMYWEDAPLWNDEKENSRIVYENHNNLTLCARDSVTYDLMCESYPNCKVITVPDMVLSCEWSDYYDAETNRDGALLCLKTDKESILTDNDKNRLEQIASKLCGKSRISNTNYEYAVTLFNRIVELQHKLNEFRSAKMVITDRLHGMIFAIITGTPCVVLNNCNHKLRSNFEWVRDMKHIRFAESVGDVGIIASEVLRAGNVEYSAKTFGSMFDELTTIFNKMSCKEE